MRNFVIMLFLMVPVSLSHADSIVTAEELANTPLTEVKSGHSTNLKQMWEKYKAEHDLSEGSDKETGVYISHAEAATNRMPEEGEKFIRSRINAFNRAFLKAKGKLIESISQTIERREYLGDIVGADDTKTLDQMARIEKKAADLSEAMLDKANMSFDPEYDPDQHKSKEEKVARAKETYRRVVKAAAERAVVGAMPITIIEGEEESEKGDVFYNVLVGLVWSPRMNRDARAIIGQHDPVLGPPGPGVDASLPNTVGEAVASWGVTRTTDKQGNRILVSYGQAAVRDAQSAKWSAKAKESALSAAELEARGALRAFAGETIVLSEERTVMEAAKLLVDGAEDNEESESRSKLYESVAKAVEIRGAEIVMEHVVPHPANNAQVAIVAVTWSGATQRVAKSLEQSMQAAQKDLKKRVEEARKAKAKVKGSVILQRSNVNKNDL